MSTENLQTLVAARQGTPCLISTHRVLRNTYGLLSMTLLFSAAIAAASAAFALPHPGLLLTLTGFFGLLFLTCKLRDSGWGVLSVFGLTGLMSCTLGSILGQHLELHNGHQVVMMGMGGTATIFVALSACALETRKDFGFTGGFRLGGIVVAFLVGLGALFFDVPALLLTVSAAFVLLMGGLILFETSRFGTAAKATT